MGCAKPQDAKCAIIMLDDTFIRSLGWTTGHVLRHEMAHCNGWPPDHPGLRKVAQNNVIVHTPEFKPPVVKQETGTPISEEARDRLVAATYKRCIKNRNDSPGLVKTYSQSETEEYCGCFSTKTIALATPEILAAARELNTGNWPESTNKDIDEITRYCQKYLNIPDISNIKSKKW
jgi:hypothetical protein